MDSGAAGDAARLRANLSLRPPARTGPAAAPRASRIAVAAVAVGAGSPHRGPGDGGLSFGADRRIAPGPGHADAPKIELDDRGRLHLAYAVSAAGPLARYAVYHTRTRPGRDRFAPPRAVSLPPPGRYPGAGYPYLAVAGDGAVHIVFELFTGDAREPSKALGIVRSVDGGERFSEPVVVPGIGEPEVNGSTQGLLMAKLDATGDATDDATIAVVTGKFDPGRESRIRLRRATSP